MNIVVLGYIVRGPLGGLAWHHLQYVLALRKLGHTVLFMEDSDDFEGCYNPETAEVNKDPFYGLNFIKELFTHFDLNRNWAYYDAHTNNWYGLSSSYVFSFCAKADLVLNISGVNPVRSWWEKIPCRVLIDTDPGFTQIKHLTDKKAMEFARSHTSYFSFAENMGKKSCSIPFDGLNWQPTRQPVFLESWNVLEPTPFARWTTVMQWDSYSQRTYDGKLFGMKSQTFGEFEKLPGLLCAENFEIAMGSPTAPIERLRKLGWHIINSLIPTKTAWTYQDYIHASKGEFMVAKHGYVSSNSGWFSERSLCYMASGKPVVVQDTGFSSIFPTGNGLIAFNTIEDVLQGIELINSNYNAHCRQARLFVEEYFDSGKVLNHLLHNIS